MRESRRIELFLARETSRKRYARYYGLPATAKQIWLDVFDAMQNAEELGGPEGADYVALMEAIADEANTRAAIARERL